MTSFTEMRPTMDESIQIVNNKSIVVIHLEKESQSQLPSEENNGVNGEYPTINNNDNQHLHSGVNILKSDGDTKSGEMKDSRRESLKTSENSGKDSPHPFQKYAGMIFTLIASLFFSIVVLIVKILNNPAHGFHSYASSFWRYFGILIPSIPLVLFCERRQILEKKKSVFETVWPIKGFKKYSEKWVTIFHLSIRGLLGASSVILRYFALDYLSIGDTAVITYATPILVTLMAHFCLGEKAGVVPFIAAFVTFGGVLVMTRPPFLTGQEKFDTENLVGISFAVGSLICSSLIVIITRKIRKVHFALMTLVFGAIGVLQSLTLTQIFYVFHFPAGLDETLLIIGLMSLAFFGQMAIIMGLKLEQAGPVSLIRCCDVIFCFILQFIFLGVVPDILSAVGGILVLSCVTITGIRKWLSTLPENDEQRRRFRFLLI